MLACSNQQERLDIGEDNDQELKHLEAWAARFTEVFDTLQSWQNDLDTVELNANLFTLWYNLNELSQSVPKRFEILKAIWSLNSEVKPENYRVDQLAHFESD